MSVGDRQAGGEPRWQIQQAWALGAQPYQNYLKAEKIHFSSPRYKHSEPCPADGHQAALWRDPASCFPCPVGAHRAGAAHQPLLLAWYEGQIPREPTAGTGYTETKLIPPTLTIPATSLSARQAIAVNWDWACCNILASLQMSGLRAQFEDALPATCVTSFPCIRWCGHGTTSVFLLNSPQVSAAELTANHSSRFAVLIQGWFEVE